MATPPLDLFSFFFCSPNFWNWESIQNNHHFLKKGLTIGEKSKNLMAGGATHWNKALRETATLRITMTNGRIL